MLPGCAKLYKYGRHKFDVIIFCVDFLGKNYSQNGCLSFRMDKSPNNNMDKRMIYLYMRHPSARPKTRESKSKIATPPPHMLFQHPSNMKHVGGALAKRRTNRCCQTGERWRNISSSLVECAKTCAVRTWN